MKKFTCILLSVLTLCLTGCAPVTEVRERLYIQAAEYAAAEHNALTVQLYPFAEDAADCTGTGMALTAAVNAAQIQAGKDIFMGHLELLCIHPDTDTALLQESVDAYRLSPSCRVICLPEQDAALPANADTLHLTDMLHRAEESGTLPQTDLFHVLSELAGTDASALLPVYEADTFRMGILKPDGFCGTLSENAAIGLCWLRREQIPERIVSKTGETFTVDNAHTTLSAHMEGDIPVVTVRIKIRGTGTDAEAACAVVRSCCEQAESETLETYHADVIGLATCLAHDCPAAFSAHEFQNLKQNVRFVHDISISVSQP